MGSGVVVWEGSELWVCGDGDGVGWWRDSDFPSSCALDIGGSTVAERVGVFEPWRKRAIETRVEEWCGLLDARACWRDVLFGRWSG